MVGSSVTRADLKGTTITGQNKGTGIYAAGGAGNGTLTMRLEKVDIKGVEMGVMMEKGESLTISGNSTIEFVGSYGVKVGKDVKSADLKETRITGERKGYGVHAVGTEKMTLDRVDIKGVGMGVMMMGGGVLEVMGNSTISFVGDYGVGVYVGGDVTSASLMRTVITGKGKGSTGVYAMGEDVTMTVADVTISGVQMGITMMGGGDLTVTGQSTINFMGGYGVMVGDKVTADLVKVRIEGDGKGMGTGVIMEGSGKMMLTEVGISKVKTGVYADNGALEIKGRTTIDFKENGWGVYVEKLVKSVSLDDVTIRGEDNGYGIHAVGSEEMVMMLKDVRVSKVGKGVYARGGKKLTINGNSTIDFTGEYGVKVEGLGTTHLTKTRIVGKESVGGRNNGVSVGVYAVGGETMRLTGVDISKVQTGVSMELGSI
ncbi:right-handed parallel beta-helix repeat-containing protein [Bartonella schoenbuchensis]|uniref:Right handed beta helix domain-containing protein n=1 Tax=Bartonella schoenbuchensis m07a TaxID=1094496 RepID=N6VDG1_9HYPH|nr:right-handed parallel beta-helix repeat-containing protein [Bartonella schoenbuchensis]ENN91331.1 hypothetical protein m07a_02020 [Bartonella schoenbuchensis m07a]